MKKKQFLMSFLCFLLCFLMAIPALADQTPLEIRVGKLTYLPSGNQSGSGWSYSVKGTAKSLTLDNFNGDWITVGLDDEFQGDKMTIILAEGTVSKIQSLNAWVFMDTGNYTPVLKIQGNGKLIVWKEPSRVKSLRSAIQDASELIPKLETELARAREELTQAQEELTQVQEEAKGAQEEAERAQEEEKREREEAASSSTSTSWQVATRETLTIGMRPSQSSPKTLDEMTPAERAQELAREYQSRVKVLEANIQEWESRIRSLEAQIQSTHENIAKYEADLPSAYTDADPAIHFDEGINVVLDDSLRMVGGLHEGDREPLTFVKKSSQYCAVTPDGSNAAYVEIAPAGFVEPVPLPTNFVDVPAGAYYVEPVKWALRKGVTMGVSETNFAPADTCTRGQVATFLWRANGCPEPATTDNPFTDVDPSSAFYKAILWAAENGITSGTSETTFSPGNPCTRAHVVTFLWRSQGKPAATGAAPLADSLPQGYYTDAVRWADSAGLLDGTGEAFAPSALCPRADIVTYLYRVLNS